MKRPWSVWLASILVPVPLIPVKAQVERPMQFAVAGGLSRDVMGNFTGSRNGGHGALMLERGGERFGARAELMHHRFRSERQFLVCLGVTVCPDIRDREEVSALALAGTMGAPIGPTRLYLIGGIGAYRFVSRQEVTTLAACPECNTAPTTSTSEKSSAHFGASGGVGVSYDAQPVGVFLELRYHHLVGGGSDKGILPVSLGVRF